MFFQRIVTQAIMWGVTGRRRAINLFPIMYVWRLSTMMYETISVEYCRPFRICRYSSRPIELSKVFPFSQVQPKCSPCYFVVSCGRRFLLTRCLFRGNFLVFCGSLDSNRYHFLGFFSILPIHFLSNSANGQYRYRVGSYLQFNGHLSGR